MKKIVTIIVCLFALQYNIAAQMGGGKGFFGGGYMSTLPNADDKKADQRLDFSSTFKYNGGFEMFTFKDKNFGYGAQFSYHTAGQAYTGNDTLYKVTMKATTDLTYAKVAVLGYYHSFNRYHPERKFRFVSFFGPYFAYLVTYQDQIKQTDASNTTITTTFKGTYDNIYTEKSSVNASLTDTFKKPLYKPMDYGFVFSFGGEYFIKPRFSLALAFRADVGVPDIENKTNIEIKTTTPPYTIAYSPWDNLYAKYNAPYIPKNKLDIRGITRNVNLGANLTLRFYGEKQYDK